jgi:hypothetical protein
MAEILQCVITQLSTCLLKRLLLDCALYEQTLSNRDQAKPIPAAITQAVTVDGFGGTSSADGMRTVDFSAPVRMHNKVENGKFVFSSLNFNTVCLMNLYRPCW